MTLVQEFYDQSLFLNIYGSKLKGANSSSNVPFSMLTIDMNSMQFPECE